MPALPHARNRFRRRLIPALVTLAISAAALPAPASASTPTSDPTPLELQNGQLSRGAAGQGMVLLENKARALPLRGGGNVALFGAGSIFTVPGGTGSGQVNNRDTVTVAEGLKANGFTVTTDERYSKAVEDAYKAKYGDIDLVPIRPAVDYGAIEQALTAQTVRPSSGATDTAIFVLSRNSGEATDRTSGAGDYLLNDVERANLELISTTYKKVIVVLNVGGIVDTQFMNEINRAHSDKARGYALDALLLMSQPGQEAGNALVDVLTGAVNPSGRLTDTWASAYRNYPASATFGANDGDSLTEEYKEGIYVGYRYFDSFAKTIKQGRSTGGVTYPFGYGLSYTSFDVDAQRVTADKRRVRVQVRVKNTGYRHAGKQVVQVYFSAPQRGLDKPKQELVGYAKTTDLQPGKSQRLTIEFPTTELSSYDERRSAYVMDAGDYLIRVGDSSRNTKVAAKLRLPQRVVTERLSPQLTAQQPKDELQSRETNFYSYPNERREIARAETIRLDLRGLRAPDNASDLDQSVPVNAQSPQFPLDHGKLSRTTAYLDRNQTDWGGTGAPYQAQDGERIRYVKTNPKATLYDVKAGRISMTKFVAGLSLDQLADIVEGSAAAGSTPSGIGAAGYTTAKYEKLGIPGMTLADGPAGLRLTQVVKDGSTNRYQFATAWPIGTMLAQTWDRALIRKVGEGVGKEQSALGVTLWLAPGMNIHRDPLNGRNFEYFSEDPLLTGMVATDLTLGVQETPGVGVTVKHYIANQQETDRTLTNSVIGERAARELYLKGFEIAVKAAQPMAVMTSYNKVNGTYAASNYDLNEDILRGEWGFRGLIMSDWGAVPRAGLANTLYSGNDLVEPGNVPEEVLVAIKQVAPSIDVSGLPVYIQTRSLLTLQFRWRWAFGSLALKADGKESFSTTLDSSTDLSKAPASMVTQVDAINNVTYRQHPPFTSVDEAYREVTDYLSPQHAALTAEQKAAFTLSNVQHEDPADESSPVVAYTLTVKGDYPTGGHPLRLGDLQRSAHRILNVAMQSESFAHLAQQQGVKGVRVNPYSTQFPLTSYLEVKTGRR